MDLNKVKHVHMVGIGGIGMSGLADILLAKGLKVSGSDLKNNNLTEKLKMKGCNIRTGHKEILGLPEIVVRSFSVKDDNPEIMDARRKNIPVLERMQLLKILFDLHKKTVAVTGTHGKTTTTAMVSYIFERAGLDPTALIGGEFNYFEGNARTGKGNIFVSEVDESDGLLVDIASTHTIITNVEKDHMEHYGTMENLLKTFEKFIKKQKDRVIIYNKDDDNLKKLMKKHDGKSISYCAACQADFYPVSIKENGFSTEFLCFRRYSPLGRVLLNVPGRHNVFNALAAIACGMEFGLSFDTIRDILSSFRGVKRRFEVKSLFKQIMLVEDYAHHPTEIRTVIDIANKIKKRKIIAVFQPHRFTRTSYLENEFSKAFRGVDELILTDIYAASETPIKGVSVNNIYNGVRESGLRKVRILEKEKLAPYLKNTARTGDIILVLGAGDINGIIPDVERAIEGERKI